MSHRKAILAAQYRARTARGHGRPAEALEHEFEAARLEALAYAAHECLRCGRPLTDPESILLGIGPDCRRIIDLLERTP